MPGAGRDNDEIDGVKGVVVVRKSRWEPVHIKDDSMQLRSVVKIKTILENVGVGRMAAKGG